MTRQGATPGLLGAGALPDPADVEGLLEYAHDIAIHVDGQGVVIGISVSSDCPSLGCLDHWVGRDILGFLTIESREKFSARIAEMSDKPDAAPRPIELNHVDNATWEFPIRYTMHRVRGGASVLMLGRDLEPVAEVQQRLVKVQMARERDLQKLRAETTFYKVVLGACDSPLLLVEPNKGKIQDLNHAAATLLGSKVETLTGSSFAQVFEGRKSPEFMDSLKGAAEADQMRSVEAVARRNGQSVRIFPDVFRAAGELFVLCKLTSVESDAATGPEVAQSLAALFTSTGDAVVLTDSKGIITEANEAFLILADAAQLRDVRGASLADFLFRGSIDLKLMLNSAAKSTRMSNYATHMQSVNGTRANVEISAARLAQERSDLGYGFIIRDTTRNDVAEADVGEAAVSEEAMKNVMDLVGTASLKELVSATSDVVEKMCIETAVQLTGNNRVAAAEMLGLSRQSLYVKLRKYGMINGGADD